VDLSLKAKVLDMNDVYSILKSLNNMGGLEDIQFYNKVIDYLVDKGYDEDDMREVLGLQRGSKLVLFLLKGNTNLQNNNFLVHVESFIQDNLKQFKLKQLDRL